MELKLCVVDEVEEAINLLNTADCITICNLKTECFDFGINFIKSELARECERALGVGEIEETVERKREFSRHTATLEYFFLRRHVLVTELSDDVEGWVHWATFLFLFHLSASIIVYFIIFLLRIALYTK